MRRFMAHKGATQQRNSGRRPIESGVAAVRPSRTEGLTRALWVVLALSVAVAVVQLYIHGRLRASTGYTSFCNVSATVNCDAVMGSAYGALLGVPIAGLGLLSYGLLGALLFWRARTVGRERTTTVLGILGLALWNLCFAGYMAGLSLFVIHALCLLCSGTYLLVAVTALLAWRLARIDLAASGQSVVTRRRTLATGGAIAAGIAAVAVVQLESRPISAENLTAADVRSRDPEFYEWYTKLPVRNDLPPVVHEKGSASAPVTIVEFSDFECPACAMAFRDLHDVADRYPNLVRIVYHHFPLDSDCNPNVATRMHPDACGAAIAAECAARAGKFWDYHDLLFGGQGQLGRDGLIAKAATLGIPREVFVACLDDPASRAAIADDTAAGKRLGIKSTPTLFINGRAVEGALDRNHYEYVIALERRS